MKTRLLTLAALIVTLSSISPVLAQNYGSRCTNPNPYPTPQPVPSGHFLGVYTSTVPVDLGNTGSQPMARSNRIETRVVPGYGESVYGQRINQIVPNSPAFHAGLEPGDIILDANGYPMDSKQDLSAAIQASQGYLEMKVLDGRSGQLMWVVAQTDSQNPTPVLTNNGPQNTNRPVYRTQQRTSNNAPRTNGNGGNVRNSNQLSQQVGSAIDLLGGRRPPVRRNR